jgi:hypothetical protein
LDAAEVDRLRVRMRVDAATDLERSRTTRLDEQLYPLCRWFRTTEARAAFVLVPAQGQPHEIQALQEPAWIDPHKEIAWPDGGEDSPADVYHCRNSLCNLFLLVNMAWLVLVMVMDAHPELRILETNLVRRQTTQTTHR